MKTEILYRKNTKLQIKELNELIVSGMIEPVEVPVGEFYKRIDDEHGGTPNYEKVAHVLPKQPEAIEVAGPFHVCKDWELLKKERDELAAKVKELEKPLTQLKNLFGAGKITNDALVKLVERALDELEEANIVVWKKTNRNPAPAISIGTDNLTVFYDGYECTIPKPPQHVKAANAWEKSAVKEAIKFAQPEDQTRIKAEWIKDYLASKKENNKD